MPGDDRSTADRPHLTGDERVGRALNEFIDRRARGGPVSEAEALDQHRENAKEPAGREARIHAVARRPDGANAVAWVVARAR